MFLKKYKNLLLLFFFTTTIFGIQNRQEVFLQANNFYKDGNFQSAYELYKKIPNPGAKLNYNLGNCAYQLKDYGKAMLYWKRAEKDWGFFGRGELLQNIELLKQKIVGSQIDESEYLSFFKSSKRYFISLLRSAPIFGFQILFLFFWIICFLYIRFLFKKKHKFLIYILFILMAFSGGFLVVRYSLDFKNYGIVISKEINILSGPGDNFQKLGILPQTSQIRVQTSSGEYYKIKFQRLIGWVSQKDVEKI
jgi:tetratricopeptide (TPR) repeat protein